MRLAGYLVPSLAWMDCQYLRKQIPYLRERISPAYEREDYIYQAL
jgi:hypothetical protein